MSFEFSLTSSSLNMCTKLSIALALFSVAASQETGGYQHNPTGEPYVHDHTGDFEPYKLWKLRQEAKLGTPPTARSATLAYKQPTQRKQT